MVCSGVRAQALLRVRSLRRKTPHAPGEAAHIGLSSFSGISHELVQVPAPRSPVPPLGRTWQNAQRDRNESSARLAEGHFQRTTGRTTVPFSLSGRQQADGSERTAAASDSRVGSDAAQHQLVHVLLLLLPPPPQDHPPQPPQLVGRPAWRCRATSRRLRPHAPLAPTPRAAASSAQESGVTAGGCAARLRRGRGEQRRGRKLAECSFHCSNYDPTRRAALAISCAALASSARC